MKRCLLGILSFMTLVFSAHADKVQIDGLYYNLNTDDRTASVTYQNNTATNYSKLQSVVVIPGKVTSNNIEFTVTSIEDAAFANCTTIESISIPASVTQVGQMNDYVDNEKAPNDFLNSGKALPFYKCTNLKKVIFEDSETPISLGLAHVTSLSLYLQAKGLFYYCPLEDVYLGRNIVYPYPNLNSFEAHPEIFGWSAFYKQSKLTKVTIGDKVTTIHPYLFYKNASITLLTLPHVKTIGTCAFESCSRLTTVNLGDALETVGVKAFYLDSNITKLTLPNTTKSIGNSAFRECTSVTEITLGTGLESIDSYAFYGNNSFTALILPNGFTTMGESAFEGCAKLTVAKLGESLTAVPAKAFKDCTSLSEMIVPASAETIGDQAFYNDSGLATITMKEGLKTIGNEVFWNNSGLMTVTIPGSVTSLGTNCFYGCTNLTYLTFSESDETLTINNTDGRSSKIDARLTSSSNQSLKNRYNDYFYDCPIRFITLGRNLSYSYADSKPFYEPGKINTVYRATAPFYNCSELRSVTIGPKVTNLNNHIFDNCKNLSMVSMNETLQTVHAYAFNECDALTTITFPGSLLSLEDYSMSNCDMLQTITFKDGLNNPLTIGDFTFYNCTALTSAVLPSHLSSLGNNAFENCSSLTNMVFNEKDTYKPNLKIGNNTFAYCSAINTLKFPERLVSIGNYAFAFCNNIKSLTFPAKLTSIGDYAFKRCDYLTEVSFSDSNKAITLGYGAAVDGGSNDAKDKPLFGNSNLEKLYIGRNIDYSAVQEKGYSPFYKQTFLKDVKFSQAGTVTYCKDYLLYNVRNCENLVLPESLKEIGPYTFSEMRKLNGIKIPNNVTSIGYNAFENDIALEYVSLSTSCAWLQSSLFRNCSNLKSITIPPVVTKMSSYVFYNCKSLTEAIFESGSEMIEMDCDFRTSPLETLYLDRWLSYSTNSTNPKSPFYGIAQLKNLTLGEHVQVIDKYMFSYCTGLEEVILPDNITSVGLWGFRGCSSLKKVKFSQKLSQISDYGFSECTSLDNVAFPASMTAIADNSFSNCTSLKKLDLGSSLMIIGPSAFMNDTSLEGFEIPETLYGLGVEAFKGCTSLPNVTIRYISSVGARAFQDCTGIKWISLSDKTTSLGEDSFAGCTGINYVKSYATFPPEGLVNFAKGVPENGTLFVPEASIMYYQFSPTWEKWLNIRPINDNNIMVSGITLNKNELFLNVAATEKLIAKIENDDATDKRILWSSSNEKVATVDESGFVSAVSVGQTTITALAADGSGIKTECLVTVSNNSFYIPDFKIAIGETKTVSIILDNLTPFSAFHTDICLPKGLTIENNSFVLSSRANGSHTVSADNFSDGMIHINCISTNNDVFTDSKGTLLSFNITANNDVAETCQIELKNQIFSKADAKEFNVPNSITKVTTERALVESITLNNTNLSLVIGESEQLTATVLPTFAFIKDVEWRSESPDIVTVSPDGFVKAVGIGTAVIRVEAVDGSDIWDECTVKVSDLPGIEYELTEDFTIADNGFPMGVASKPSSPEYYTSKTTGIKYSIMGCYINTYYLFVNGKNTDGAFISFSLNYLCKQIKLTTSSGCSTNTNSAVNVYADGMLIGKYKVNRTNATFKIDIPEEYRSAGTVYKIESATTSYNQQFVGFTYVCEIPTLVDNVQIDSSDAIIVYNLQGIRLNINSKDELYRLTPGIYIVNGKKMLIK